MYMSSKVWSHFLRDVVCHSVSRPIGVLRLINFMTEVTCIWSCHCKKGFSLETNLHLRNDDHKKAVYSFILIHHSPNRVYYCSIFISLVPNMSKNLSPHLLSTYFVCLEEIRVLKIQ